MSGGPVIVQLADGRIEVAGILSRFGSANGNERLNALNGTNLASHISNFAALDWLLHRGAGNR